MSNFGCEDYLCRQLSETRFQIARIEGERLVLEAEFESFEAVMKQMPTNDRRQLDATNTLLRYWFVASKE